MRNVTVSAIQFSMVAEKKANIDTAIRLSREAVDKGASIILLPELFERPYFCQERNYSYYNFADCLNDNLAVKEFEKFTLDTQTCVIVSFYEKDVNVLYNSVAIIENGKILGIYRKTHIPDDHYYQEKFYFTPGNTGFRTFSTSYGVIGVGICWDQWFPECARALALNGAEIIFYPTAIGSEPILDTDSMPHWRRAMQGHSASNLVPVVAANRYGLEKVTPTKENGGQSSELKFYGSSFITDNTGKIVSDASREGDCVLTYSFDLDECNTARLEWGLFRDRRPKMYKDITK